MKPKKPTPPAELSPEARQLWQQIFEEVELDTAAVLILNTTMRQWDRAQEARKAIAKEGAVVPGRFPGMTRANPWCQIERDATAALMRGWRLLGFDQVPSGAMGRPPGR